MIINVIKRLWSQVHDPVLPSIASPSKLAPRFRLRMSPVQIKRRLRAKGLTLADIDRKAGAASKSASHCIYGEARHQKVREILADVLGLSVDDIFGDEPAGRPRLSIRQQKTLAGIRRDLERQGQTSWTVAQTIGVSQGIVSKMLNGSNFYPAAAAEINSRFGVAIPDMRRRRVQQGKGQ